MSEMSFVRKRQNVSLPSFIVDQHTVVRDNGRQIDWDALGDTFVNLPQIVKVNGAVAKGAVSITVDVLPFDLKIGDVLDFGELDPVIVTVGAAGALATATSIPVAALSGPIPSGTVLDFGTNKFARLTADAVATDTALTVAALPTALVSTNTATYKGGELVAFLDAAAAAGDTTVSVEEVPVPIPDNAEAILPLPVGYEIERGRHVKAGTVVDLNSDGKIVPSSLNTGGLTAYGILLTNADEFSETDSASGYGVVVSASVYENLLPDQSGGTINGTWKTELLARGGWWLFGPYADNT